MENGLPFVEVCWAAQRAGLIYTAISRYLKADEIAYIVEDCGAKVFVASADAVDQVSGLVGKPGGPILLMTGEPAPGFRSFDREARRAAADAGRQRVRRPRHAVLLRHDGRPKGVETALTPIPMDAINPLLKILCCDMCGVDANSVYLSPAPPLPRRGRCASP